MFATRILAIATFLALPPTQPQQSISDVIAKLDAASAKFQNAEAHVHRVSWNHIIHDTDDTSDGTTYFKRVGAAGIEMGLATTGKEARIVEYKSGTIRAYNPGLKCYDAVTRPGLDTYLTLGFGGSGKDLEKAWNILDDGSETIDNTKVEKLELTPKDPAVKANVTKITVWVDLTRGISLKQLLLSSTGDTNTATYSAIKYNQKSIEMKPYTFSGKPCGK